MFQCALWPARTRPVQAARPYRTQGTADPSVDHVTSDGEIIGAAGLQVVSMWQQESGLGPSGQVRVTPFTGPLPKKGIQHGHFTGFGWRHHRREG